MDCQQCQVLASCANHKKGTLSRWLEFETVSTVESELITVKLQGLMFVHPHCISSVEDFCAVSVYLSLNIKEAAEEL